MQVTDVTLRAVRSHSGRVVADIDPSLKRDLHAALARTGRTLKDWIIENAKAEVAAQTGRYLETRRSSHHPLFGPDTVESRPSTALPVLNRPLTVISMFSGCGGMDLGFKGGFNFLGQHYPRLPYEIVWANDNNLKACATYQKNIGDHIVPGDVWDAMASMPQQADLIVGGFPCQDISINGKRAGINGSRSGLYRAMVQAVKNVRPRVFVAENVKGLLTRTYKDSLATVIEDFSKLGYRVTYDLYQAADYGVPQTRERVFIVGVRDQDSAFSAPLAPLDMNSWVTAREAIDDLIDLPEDEAVSHIWSRAARSPEQGNRRMVAERPGYTIRAECHGNIQYHYTLDRRISMREAARFQSFPDTFVFEAKLRETERMIGNAVPPVLAWHVAAEVARHLA